MSAIKFYLSSIIIAFVLAFLDSLLPVPVTPTMAIGAYQTEHPVIYIVIVGIFIGLGSTFSLFTYRLLFQKIKKLSNSVVVQRWRLRITILIDDLGYFVIIPLQATNIGAMVNATFIFSKKIHWKKYILYTIIGRTLVLALFSAQAAGNKNILITFFIVGIYAILFIILIIKLIIKRGTITKILIDERKLNKKIGVIPPSRFAIINNIRKIGHIIFVNSYCKLIFKRKSFF